MGTLLMGAALAGCAGSSPAGDLAPQPPTQAGISYLALGDSYTIGESVAPNGRWPNQLAHALRAQGIALADPRIIATTGWTTDELSDAMDAADVNAPLGHYGFVSLAIGVNNQYRGRDVGNYRVELTALLERAIRLAEGNPQHVVMLSIPDWGVTPFARESGRELKQITDELDAYNAAAQDICRAHGVAFVNITHVSRASGAQPGMLAEDGLHPSAAMYVEWTRLVLPVVRELLAGK
ncbi:MAG: SGNH/GDSL hydrolase family protein [Thermomonas sp.]